MCFVVPDACALPTAERPSRLAESDELLTTADWAQAGLPLEGARSAARAS
ncbi:hypothetical protein [Actinoplanes aureus]|uniref:Uncharacterized protein n=1 Tax=Actinoplanes aureus TaxID=2792083 RepID=A0A931G3V5_9ACTN|nr:hypothetical protein [Actinoplanes aureus]MBG0567331.1 hypothetical protein [Actinoplanes aureus]